MDLTEVTVLRDRVEAEAGRDDLGGLDGPAQHAGHEHVRLNAAGVEEVVAESLGLFASEWREPGTPLLSRDDAALKPRIGVAVAHEDQAHRIPR